MEKGRMSPDDPDYQDFELSEEERAYWTELASFHEEPPLDLPGYYDIPEEFPPKDWDDPVEQP